MVWEPDQDSWGWAPGQPRGAGEGCGVDQGWGVAWWELGILSLPFRTHLIEQARLLAVVWTKDAVALALPWSPWS